MSSSLSRRRVGRNPSFQGGVIARLDLMQDHKDPFIREKVQEALWLLVPEVEEAVTSKPQDES